MSKKKKDITSRLNFKRLKKNLLKKIEMMGRIKFTPLRVVVLSFVILFALIYLLRSSIFAAFVNKTPILRHSVRSTAEKQSGEAVLENLIEKALVQTEAKNLKIKVNDEEINDEIEGIRKMLDQQNITLEDALALSNQDMDTLAEQIEVQKIIEKILGSDINIEDQDIEEYFEENKEYFGNDALLEDYYEQLKEELFNQELSARYNSWIEDLKTNANIKYFVNY